MVFEKSFKLLMATGTTQFFVVVSIISEEDSRFNVTDDKEFISSLNITVLDSFRLPSSV